MDYQTILLEKSDRIATLTLNRPKALNGISFEMMDEIDAALEDLRGDSGVKALVVTGAGRAFSVGADIGLLTDAFGDEGNGRFRYFLERINAMLLNLEALPMPVIAKVNGLARAGGFEIILCCDLAVVADEARIGDNHTMFGVMPGGGATQRAPRKIGWQRAVELIYTGRWLTGPEAVEYGVALKSVPLADLDTAVEDLVAQLREKSRDCLGFVKKAAFHGLHQPIREGVNTEIRYFMEYLGSSPDAREGFNASREGRPPTFAG